MKQSLSCSPWIDYTEMHESIRKELEDAIKDYIINSNKDIRTPIIVAPYGSGKTTLLRHLLCYSLFNDIPAVKINLSLLVNFLKSKHSGISEDKIVDPIVRLCNKIFDDIRKCLTSNCQDEEIKSIIEEYDGLNKETLVKIIDKWFNSSKCVLLIDEVEESYEESLKSIKIFENIPYVDLIAYDRALNEVKDYEKPLFIVLSMLIGPVPESKLRSFNCINISLVEDASLSRYFVRSNMLIKLSDVLQVLEDILSKFGLREMDFAHDMLNALLLSRSNGEYIILNNDALRDLINIAKDMAIEFYQPNLFNVLNSIDLRKLYDKLKTSALETPAFYTLGLLSAN